MAARGLPIKVDVKDSKVQAEAACHGEGAEWTSPRSDAQLNAESASFLALSSAHFTSEAVEERHTDYKYMPQ